jgi:hypothetical protein
LHPDEVNTVLASEFGLSLTEIRKMNVYEKRLLMGWTVKVEQPALSKEQMIQQLQMLPKPNK